MTTKEALFRYVIQPHWQRQWQRWAYSADGCGSNLYSTAKLALIAWERYQDSGKVETERELRCVLKLS